MKTTMRTALVRESADVHHVIRRDDYPSQKAFAEDLRGNGYRVLKIWNGDISDDEASDWHWLNRNPRKKVTAEVTEVPEVNETAEIGTEVNEIDAAEYSISQEAFDFAVAWEIEFAEEAAYEAKIAARALADKTKNVVRTPVKFEVGKTYTTGKLVLFDNEVTITILKRTDKFIHFIFGDGELDETIYKRKVKCDYGVETLYFHETNALGGDYDFDARNVVDINDVDELTDEPEVTAKASDEPKISADATADELDEYFWQCWKRRGHEHRWQVGANKYGSTTVYFIDEDGDTQYAEDDRDWRREAEEQLYMIYDERKHRWYDRDDLSIDRLEEIECYRLVL